MSALPPQDQKDILAHGLSLDDARRQKSLLENPPPTPVLLRPCAVDDGILSLKADESASYHHLYDKAREEGRLSKFIPASGAATRMFKSIAAYRLTHPEVTLPAVEEEAAARKPDAAEVLAFLEGLPRFAFYEQLRDALVERKFNPSVLLNERRYTPWLDVMLDKDALNFAALPKGLLPFHRVKDGFRTAFEEHIVESLDVLRSGEGVCRLHLTVAGEHEALFKDHAAQVLPRLEKSRRARFDVTFSAQKASTDTLSLDGEGRLVRRRDGRILFRPGGHGALLENLNDLSGDLVFVKNIDNVPHESNPGESSYWDALLCGLLLDLQFHLFQRITWLSLRPNDLRLLVEAEDFAARRLNILPPESHGKAEPRHRREWLLSRLNRPIRVCAVVKNTGAPGGAPFWVQGPDGEPSPQIVESAQVAETAAQRAVFAAASHFNPVHMVLGLRNARGEKHDLRNFTDPDAVFIAEKSVDGRPLKALERPGLWNGAMAKWTTVFVEAPLSTFHPVKTISDLLRPDHQPA